MQKVKDYLISHLDRDNRVFIFFLAFFPGVLSSVVSFMLVIAMIGAILFMALKWFPWIISQRQKAALFAISAYPIVMILAVLVNYQAGDSLSWIIRVVPFFAGWLVLARMRMSPEGTLLPQLVLGAGVGMLVTFGICVIQVLFVENRVAGGAGNAAVLGLFTVLFSNISLLNAHSKERAQRVIAILGFVAGLACLLMSETRSAWLAMPVNLVIALLYLNNNIIINYKKLAAPTIVALIAIAVIFSPKISTRVQALQLDIEALENSPQNLTSLNVRLIIWNGALQAFAEKPFLGHGPQNRIAAVENELPTTLVDQLAVTHLHNAFLNVAVDAGIVGVLALLLALAAPIIAATSKKRGPERDMSMAVALILVSSYLITGMFGIMFGHDATDAVYISVFLIICHTAGQMRANPTSIRSKLV